MNFSELDRLLDPAPLALETGYEPLADGSLHLACRTDMPGCSGEMLAWWFRFRPQTREYIWWHPVDHVSSHWLEVSEGTHIGSIHQVEASFIGSPVAQLLIQFREPSEFFDAQAYALALQQRRISAAISGRSGRGWDAPRDHAGRVMGSRMVHLVRDTDWGCVRRSHFFLGHDLPASGLAADAVAQAVR